VNFSRNTIVLAAIDQANNEVNTISSVLCGISTEEKFDTVEQNPLAALEDSSLTVASETLTTAYLVCSSPLDTSSHLP